MSKHRPDVLRAGGLSRAQATRNLVSAFQTALRRIIPTYKVLSYRPLNTVNIRVSYTAPVWDKTQIAVLRRHSQPQIGDRTETWTARVFAEQGREITRFEVDPLTWDFVR